MRNQSFNFDEALKQLQSGKNLLGTDGILTPLIKQLTEAALQDGAITHITDKLLPELKAWQQRPLEALYPFVWLDAIHYKIKHDGHYINKAIYTVLGLTTDGHKELLGLYMSETEGAHHWLSVLTYITVVYKIF